MKNLSTNLPGDRPHMKNDQNCDSKDLKALIRSGQKLAATAFLWLDKSH
ncbi:MAG: hypothetical protein ACFBSE_16750 [Prochloraceae cyanobacterium]